MIGSFLSQHLTKVLGGFQQQLASGFDMDKVKTTIKQFYRDWSSEVGYR